MTTGSRPYVLDVSRTTTIIGELIGLITELEEVTTSLGKEGYAYYKAGLFYDEVTLDLCRRVDGALKIFEQSNRELTNSLDTNLLLGAESPGPFTRLQKAFYGTLMRRETSALERALNESYFELASRIRGVAGTDPRALSAKMLRMCTALKRLEADIEARWDELEQRTKSQRKGPMFILVLNMFVVNFFKFANQQWLRHWVAHLKAFQERIGDRIHREVVHDLSVDDEAASKGPAAPSAPAARGPIVPPTRPAAPPRQQSVDLGADDP